MIRRMSRGQSGITLTEILISILILGIGMVSLATLFPLGLLRLRDATRLSRSATLTESATADLQARNLLSKNSFLNATTAPWNTTTAFTPIPYDPWVQDTPRYGTLGPIEDVAAGPFGAYRGAGCFKANNLNPPFQFIAGPGLPVAYDPMWRYTTAYYLGAASEARFASGIGFVRPDPQGGNPSAHGLQRLTNFPAGSVTSVPEIFVSPEDIVLQTDTDTSKGVGTVSPIVPDLNMGALNNITGMPGPQYDWKYTWMFTGQQADSTNGTVFVGDIVVFENRPFAVEPVTPPFATTPAVQSVVVGETVVEAIFGYTGSLTIGVSAAKVSTVGYGGRANRAVLLRWPTSVVDPEIRVGNWIADVTYERDAAVDYKRTVVDPSASTDTPPGVGPAGAFFPYQRCHWYQIAKRTEARPGQAFTGDGGVAFREMTVWVSTPLKALTLIANDNTGSPYHVNAALVSPYVVNVFPRTIYTR